MPLHTDKRVDSLDAFLGNKGVIESIKTLVKDPTRSHTYMFSGQSGTGKTTLCRILAKELNLNIDERNAANDNGVDFARSFAQDIMYPGFKGDTLYMLDEAQRLTSQAQDILLKVLEEPPRHAYIALCTTEPATIKPTIQRRCVHYSLEKPNRRVVQKFIIETAEQEGIEISNEAVTEIMSISKLSIGFVLILLEKIKGVPVDQQLKGLRGISSSQDIAINELCQICLNKNWREITDGLERIEGDAETIRQRMMAYMSRVLLNGNVNAFPYLKALENVRMDSGSYGIIRSLYEATVLRDKGGYY